LYRAPELLAEKLPVLRLLTRTAPEIETQSRRLLPALQAALGTRSSHGDTMSSQVGSGALPADCLPSFGLRLQSSRARRSGVDRLEATLRAYHVLSSGDSPTRRCGSTCAAWKWG